MDLQHLTKAIRQLLTSNFGTWQGSASDLRAALVDLRPALEDDLPAGSVWCGRTLRRALPDLHLAGVSVTFSRTPEARTITLSLCDRDDLADLQQRQRQQQQRVRQEQTPRPRPHPLRGVRW